jgi:hypothetical protein
MIFTQDHVPAHVHAVKGKDLVIFLIDCAKRKVTVRGETRMRSGTVSELQAFVKDNPTLLCETWRNLHGER